MQLIRLINIEVESVARSNLHRYGERERERAGERSREGR